MPIFWFSSWWGKGHEPSWKSFSSSQLGSGSSLMSWVNPHHFYTAIKGMDWLNSKNGLDRFKTSLTVHTVCKCLCILLADISVESLGLFYRCKKMLSFVNRLSIRIKIIQGHRSQIETFQTCDISWLNDFFSEKLTQFVGSLERKIWFWSFDFNFVYPLFCLSF